MVQNWLFNICLNLLSHFLGAWIFFPIRSRAPIYSSPLEQKTTSTVGANNLPIFEDLSLGSPCPVARAPDPLDGKQLNITASTASENSSFTALTAIDSSNHGILPRAHYLGDRTEYLHGGLLRPTPVIRLGTPEYTRICDLEQPFSTSAGVDRDNPFCRTHKLVGSDCTSLSPHYSSFSPAPHSIDFKSSIELLSGLDYNYVFDIWLL